MSRALQLAAHARCCPHPNPRVGCVIVKEGEVVGEGFHYRAGENHAEINALESAGKRAKAATVYITFEPCCHHGKTPPCTAALIAAGVVEVIIAMEDPNPEVAGKGLQQLEAAGIRTKIGLLGDQAAALNRGFVKRMKTGIPFVRCKLAMSLDGRTAMKTGESQWITSADARRDVQKMRAASDAIMTGIGTAKADDPQLNVRLKGICDEIDKQPLRLVVDSQLRLSPRAKILSVPGKTIVVCAVNKPKEASALEQAGADVLCLPDRYGMVDVEALLLELGKRQINELMIEAGATLCGTFMHKKLIDEIVVYMAPILMGDAASGLLNLPGMLSMKQKIPVEITDMRAVGKDWRITINPKPLIREEVCSQ